MGYSKIISRLCLVFLVAITCSCAYYQQYHDSWLVKKDCYAQCGAQLRNCHASCDESFRLCHQKTDAVAAVHFNQYRQQQVVKGEWVALEEWSFRDPLACTKQTCDCLQDSNVCIQSCQGTIHKRWQVVT